MLHTRGRMSTARGSFKLSFDVIPILELVVKAEMGAPITYFWARTTRSEGRGVVVATFSEREGWAILDTMIDLDARVNRAQLLTDLMAA